MKEKKLHEKGIQEILRQTLQVKIEKIIIKNWLTFIDSESREHHVESWSLLRQILMTL